MAIGIQIRPNPKLFLRDPQDTKLGRNILKASIILIDELGIEAFTFKKLAEKIESTEASVYRYFENKHLLLIYLVTWYWEWVSYQIEINTLNIDDPQKKLTIAIRTLVEASRENPAIEYINESVLHRIVIAEGVKAYHTKQVDEENKDGFFKSYKSLCKKLADIIAEVNPGFQYPAAVASSLFDMANNHIYFAQHLPRLTEVTVKDGDLSEVIQFLNHIACRLLGFEPIE